LRVGVASEGLLWTIVSSKTSHKFSKILIFKKKKKKKKKTHESHPKKLFLSLFHEEKNKKFTIFSLSNFSCCVVLEFFRTKIYLWIFFFFGKVEFSSIYFFSVVFGLQVFFFFGNSSCLDFEYFHGQLVNFAGAFKLSKFSFSNCQNFLFQTVKISFSNCQKFPFQTVPNSTLFFPFQKFNKIGKNKPDKKQKNDESRYGDVTNLSVFSILYAMMV
jgi:hypothetical protein